MHPLDGDILRCLKTCDAPMFCYFGEGPLTELNSALREDIERFDWMVKNNQNLAARSRILKNDLFTCS